MALQASSTPPPPQTKKSTKPPKPLQNRKTKRRGKDQHHFSDMSLKSPPLMLKKDVLPPNDMYTKFAILIHTPQIIRRGIYYGKRMLINLAEQYIS